ncbi:MAG TPA: prepilin-type N-terminal cleavage/methylation domain-containing protein [Chthoniobacteraceae bacterium]|nr:prepilin-type N-terminal cleavage/methylation domain-containing protein [Chthoniobacteraceae bacterium]
MQKLTPKRHSGFSLMEIIVSVVILLVLAVVLWSVMRSASAKAKGIKCSGNLKNIYVASMAYAVEHNGYLPRYRASGNGPFWQSRIKPYLDGSVFGDSSPYTIRCPSQPGWYSSFHYAMNAGISSSETPDGSWKFQSIAVPSEGFFVTDTPLEKNVSWRVTYANIDPAQSDCLIGYNHGEKANLLFLDGHVEARAPQQIPQPEQRPGNHPRHLEWQRFWRPDL